MRAMLKYFVQIQNIFLYFTRNKCDTFCLMNTTFTRQQYLNNECTHREYYSQFVTKGTKQRLRSTLKLSALKDGIDNHFNNIPLHFWDNFMPVVPYEISNKIQACGDYCTLSGIVCILKEAAMQIAEE